MKTGASVRGHWRHGTQETAPCWSVWHTSMRTHVQSLHPLKNQAWERVLVIPEIGRWRQRYLWLSGQPAWPNWRDPGPGERYCLKIQDARFLRKDILDWFHMHTYITPVYTNKLHIHNCVHTYTQLCKYKHTHNWIHTQLYTIQLHTHNCTHTTIYIYNYICNCS